MPIRIGSRHERDGDPLLLPGLSDEDLRHVAYSLDRVLRERRPPVIEDAYGALAEEDVVTVVAEAWDMLDERRSEV